MWCFPIALTPAASPPFVVARTRGTPNKSKHKNTVFANDKISCVFVVRRAIFPLARACCARAKEVCAAQTSADKRACPRDTSPHHPAEKGPRPRPPPCYSPRSVCAARVRALVFKTYVGGCGLVDRLLLTPHASSSSCSHGRGHALQLLYVHGCPCVCVGNAVCGGVQFQRAHGIPLRLPMKRG